MVRGRHPHSGRLLGAAILSCALSLAAPAQSRAGEVSLDAQLGEIGVLVREKRYPLALESLRFMARQIQDLRAGELRAVVADPPAGWTAADPVSLFDECEVWSDRVEARLGYTREGGSTKIELTIDVHSPRAPAAALGFTPLFVAADPQARLVDVAAEKGLLRFNPDTGEGELRILVARDTLVTLVGRGIASGVVLTDFARIVDFAALRARAGR